MMMMMMKMMKTFWLALYLSFLQLESCFGLGLDFLVMGDWGGSSNPPNYTTSDELSSASLMGALAAKYPIEFVLGLGDNFYEYGIQGDEYNSRFQQTFEDVFTADSLTNMSFHFIAGNHDWRGNVSAEIAHTAISTRWKFPTYYYTLNFVVPVNGKNLTLDIIMLDTVLLCGISADDEEEFYQRCDEMGIERLKCPLGQPVPGPLGGPFDKQWAWLEEELAASTANYVIVCGHYPIYSIAEHGPTWLLVDKLKPLLLKYHVSAYINGHDHSFEYIQFDNQNPVEDYIAYVTAGGTHTCDSSTAHEIYVPKSAVRSHGCENGGTVRVHVEDTLQFFIYYGDSSDTIVYSSPLINPRF